ncbi:MAG: CTP synthase [Candidatus Pacebacteria bacterium]|nr:CTP synthase [Candidatus Paceibacterota bacterium]
MSDKNRKYIFVVGGVMSGVGKGVAASSIAKILQFNGLKTTAVKIDPYVNVDAGTMNPTEHGEVFVLDDGHECDQDMGNYERFLNSSLSRDSYMTTGSAYLKVINKERSLGYKGKCVDVVPHVPLGVMEQIENAGKKEKADVVLVEIGGTLGEYQNILFLEAARMMKNKYPNDVMYALVSFLPTPHKIGEMKTKPTQYAVRTMQQTGLTPDIIIGRSEIPMDDKRKEKIAFSCSIKKECVISAPDIDSIYDVPENFLGENLDKIIINKLNIKKTKKNNKKIDEWKKFVKSSKNGKKKVKIAVVGKYFDTGDFVLSDAYISIIEALKFSAYKNHIGVELTWVNSKKFEGKNVKKELSNLKKYNGVLIPGGFGTTGIEGKIKVIEFIRKNKIPFFGICYGMQLACIEYARNVCGIKDATSYEINPNGKNKIITILPEQKKLLKAGDYGGSMRLGAYPAKVKKGSLAYKLYKTEKISERHRHRYELNEKYIEILEKKGLIVSATSPDGKLPEIIELDNKKHPFFVGVQFHPEMKARPLDPHPVFNGFIKAAKEKMDK